MEENEPFICVDVTSQTGLDYLAKQFDKLFPEKIIRLKIDGKYSPYFYLGNSRWEFKNSKQYDFVCKIVLDECISDFVEKEQLYLLDYFGTDLNTCKVIRDIKIFEKEYYGMFISNGNHHLVDQFLLSDAYDFLRFFADYFEAETKIDLLNAQGNGIIILKTQKNIFEGK